MAAFEYQALDAAGKKRKGVLEADTERQIRQQLREMALIPVSVEPAAESDKGAADSNKSKDFKSLFFTPKVSATDLALITRQLSTLVSSALPIEQALLAVADQTEKPRLQKLLLSVRAKVVEGYSLAEGMADFPRVFDKLYTAMVAAGERSGHLDEVLSRLADYTEQRQKMRSQLVQAMVYPAMLTLVAISIVVFLLVSVVPQIVEQLTDMDQTLPATTSFLLAISGFLQAYGLALLLLAAITFLLFRQAMKREEFRDKVHRKLLFMPIFGRLIRGVNTSRFSRTLSILTASAVPLLEGLRITSTVLSNRAMYHAVAEAADRVREGTSLRAALAATKLFPPMMLHMIAAGEKSGELEQMLGRAADNQDAEFEQVVQVGLKIFEPVLIVSMAGIVLFIVMAIIQPILALNQNIGF